MGIHRSQFALLVFLRVAVEHVQHFAIHNDTAYVSSDDASQCADSVRLVHATDQHAAHQQRTAVHPYIVNTKHCDC